MDHMNLSNEGLKRKRGKERIYLALFVIGAMFVLAVIGEINGSGCTGQCDPSDSYYQNIVR
jgi:hypothetical protein